MTPKTGRPYYFDFFFEDAKVQDMTRVPGPELPVFASVLPTDPKTSAINLEIEFDWDFSRFQYWLEHPGQTATVTLQPTGVGGDPEAMRLEGVKILSSSKNGGIYTVSLVNPANRQPQEVDAS